MYRLGANQDPVHIKKSRLGNGSLLLRIPLCDNILMVIRDCVDVPDVDNLPLLIDKISGLYVILCWCGIPLGYLPAHQANNGVLGDKHLNMPVTGFGRS
jgi:hypothetical protein